MSHSLATSSSEEADADASQIHASKATSETETNEELHADGTPSASKYQNSSLSKAQSEAAPTPLPPPTVPSISSRSGRPFKTVATGTQQGYIEFNPGKVNQDRYIRIADFNHRPEHAVFGVFDGHGVYGHLVSEFVAERLPQILAAAITDECDISEILISSFSQTSEALLEASSINSTFSGTTAVVTFVTPTHFYTANAGDSRAVIGRKDSTYSDGIIAVALSDDHKPERPDEKRRILDHGGRVHPCRSPSGDRIGPDRVWLSHQDVPGLAMTRSFGDTVSSTIGVTSEPEVKVVKRKSGDQFLISASDGVWEFISNQEAVDIVSRYTSPRKACQALVRESTQRWKAEEDVIDDITAVVVFF